MKSEIRILGKGLGGVMAKRFTDTDKWKKQWYRELGSLRRDVLNYLWDNCDFAGAWEIDIGALSFYIGHPVVLEDILSWFNGRILLVDTDKIFIPSFIEFQYGELSDQCKPHISVIKRLKKLTLWEGYTKGTHTLKDKDKEKDKEKEKRKGLISKLDCLPLYESYPRKIGKKKGLEICEKVVKTEADFQRVRTAISNYRDHCAREGTEPKFIKHFSTFMNSWEDWLEPNTGRSPPPVSAITAEELNALFEPLPGAVNV